MSTASHAEPANAPAGSVDEAVGRLAGRFDSHGGSAGEREGWRVGGGWRGGGANREVGGGAQFIPYSASRMLQKWPLSSRP